MRMSEEHIQRIVESEVARLLVESDPQVVGRVKVETEEGRRFINITLDPITDMYSITILGRGHGAPHMHLSQMSSGDLSAISDEIRRVLRDNDDRYQPFSALDWKETPE